MAKIWANCLIRGDKTWAECPSSRKASVLEELAARVASGAITAEKYEEITGEAYQE